MDFKGGNIEEEGINSQRKKDRKLRRQDARWTFPPKDWHKANFDGSSKGNLGLAGCGGII